MVDTDTVAPIQENRYVANLPHGVSLPQCPKRRFVAKWFQQWQKKGPAPQAACLIQKMHLPEVQAELTLPEVARATLPQAEVAGAALPEAKAAGLLLPEVAAVQEVAKHNLLKLNVPRTLSERRRQQALHLYQAVNQLKLPGFARLSRPGQATSRPRKQRWKTLGTQLCSVPRSSRSRKTAL